MTALWHCWPKAHAGAALKAAHHRHAHRIGRAMRRVGGVAIKKPAVIGWTCIAVGGGLWAGLPQEAGAVPERRQTETAVPNIHGALISPGWEIIGPPVDITPGPPTIGFPFIGPPTLLPDAPIAPDAPALSGQPVPEPSSLALLITALAGMGAAYRIIKVRADGVRLPYGSLVRSRFSARRTARLLAVTNAEPAVDHFAVSDGAGIVFRSPTNGRGDHA